jgi:hypothetical protein
MTDHESALPIKRMSPFTDAQILEIARNQERILWLLLASCVVVLGSFLVPPGVIAGSLFLAALAAIGIVATVLIYRLSKALERSPWVYVVCAFIPYVNTATLLIMNLRATAALRSRGISVGLMGANQSDLSKLTAAAKSGAATRGQPVGSESNGLSASTGQKT